MAFAKIVFFTIRFPSLRHIAEMVCRKRYAHIDVVTFSWKRRGVDRDSLWICYYNAALRCFSTHSGSVITLLVNLDHNPEDGRSLDFSYFEDIMTCCR